MDKMETEQNKKEKEKENNSNQATENIEAKKKLTTKQIFSIVLVAMVVLIAIILVSIISERQKINNNDNNIRTYSSDDIVFSVNQDEKIDSFIKEYFEARTNLDYQKIFSAYGRDYHKEEISKDRDNVKKIEETIRYEKSFVRGYENINIYTVDGYRENEIVCLVTYDLLLGFTYDSIPMMIIFYLKKDTDDYYIEDNMDVGTSKYLMDCTNTNFVRELYIDVEQRLSRILVSNEGVKLAYNTLRQFEMNMDGKINYENSKRITTSKVDLIKDADEIRVAIKNKKERERKIAERDALIDNIVKGASNK